MAKIIIILKTYMTNSAQFSCFLVNLIAYVILIEPHPVYLHTADANS